VERQTISIMKACELVGAAGGRFTTGSPQARSNTSGRPAAASASSWIRCGASPTAPRAPAPAPPRSRTFTLAFHRERARDSFDHTARNRPTDVARRRSARPVSSAGESAWRHPRQRRADGIEDCGSGAARPRCARRTGGAGRHRRHPHHPRTGRHLAARQRPPILVHPDQIWRFPKPSPAWLAVDPRVGSMTLRTPMLAPSRSFTAIRDESVSH
jgi:hypothetical protein